MNIVRTGVSALLLVLLISSALVAGFTAAFGTEFFVNWVGTFFLCGTPFQIMMAVVWRHQVPRFAGTASQPLKGVILTGLFVLAGAVITPILFYLVGHGVMSPILIHYAIQSVGISLLVIIVFGCWPVNKFIDNKVLLGLGTLVYCYVLSFVIFKLFYDYSFFSGAAFFDDSLNPGGMFNGITALTFAVTAVAFVVVLIMFEMWPASAIVKNGSQPVFGLVGTLFVLLLSAITCYLFVSVIGMEPMNFMVQGPVSIIFGAFLVDNMMQFQLFDKLKQPIRGFAKSVVCVAGALLMYRLYDWALPLFTGKELPTGPESGYLREAWIGTAMLGITFPVINIVSGAFAFWPVRRSGDE